MRGPLHKTAITSFLAAACVITGAQQPVLAEETASVSDFQNCRAIQGKAERLLCYDSIADGGVFDQEKLQQVQQETFGKRERSPDISIDELNVTVVRVQKGANGIHYFHTSGGQVWKQQDAETYSSQVPFEAEIKTGMMGSYFLVNEQGRGVRVKRVK